VVKRFQLRPRVPMSLARRLKDYAAARGVSEAAVVERALQQFLDGVGEHTILMRRLDRLDRQYVRGRRDINMLAEAFAAFVQVWYAYTPELPEEARGRVRQSVSRRYAQYVQAVTERLGRGKPFLDDLARDDFAPSEIEPSQAAELGAPHEL